MTTARTVLLTGATGFLGVYLLHALLARSTAQIYCHVRAADGAAGVERIRKALRARDLWRADVETRVIPEIAQPLVNARPRGLTRSMGSW